MRRLAVFAVLAVVCAAITGGAPAAVAPSARVALRIDAVLPSGSLSFVGSGTIDGAHGLSALDFTTTSGVRFQAIIASSSQLTVFLKGPSLNVAHGLTWARTDGAASAPLFDPALPLHLVAHHGAKVGAKTIDGAGLTGYTVALSTAEARLLSPAASGATLRRGLAGTVWLTDTGVLREFYANVPYGSGHATIDEQFLAATSPIHLALPKAATVFDPRADAPENEIRRAMPDVESYNADNGARGYSGMTPAALRRYDRKLSPQLKVVRASTTEYCIQVTVNGVTAKKDGPAATIMLGRC
jgi:hypothetical protein